jgi:hypothetical protein
MGAEENGAHDDGYLMPQEEYLNASARQANYEAGINA